MAAMVSGPDARVPGYLGRILDDNGDPVATCFQMAPKMLVTAWHVLDDIDAATEGARVRVDPLAGGKAFGAAVARMDPLHDLAVLTADTRLPAVAGPLIATDHVVIRTTVTVTGHVAPEDPGHTYRFLNASGEWAGGTIRDDAVPLGRAIVSGVMPGMSGAPVIRDSDGAVAGVVSGRYNSTDGWLSGTVWVARTEDLATLLKGIADVGIEETPRAASASSTSEGAGKPETGSANFGGTEERSLPSSSAAGDAQQVERRVLTGGISADLVDPDQGISREKDDLGVSTYVAMMATAIAGTDTKLPLSIGLFGEWGSGKSYFMGLLRKQVQELALSGQPAYCSGILQIGFNAWSYADANLWASLGDEIFRELAGPTDDKEDEENRKRREQLRTWLADEQGRVKELEATKAAATSEVAKLHAELESCKHDRRNSALTLLRATVEAVQEDKQTAAELRSAWDKLGAKDVTEQARVLADAVTGTRDDVTAIRRAAVGDNRRYLVAAVVAAGLVLVITGLASSGPARTVALATTHRNRPRNAARHRRDRRDTDEARGGRRPVGRRSREPDTATNASR